MASGGISLSTTALAAMRELSPYFEGAQHFGSGGHHHIVPQGGVALAVVLAGAPPGDPVVEQAVVADLGRLADDDAHAVVDNQPPADLRAGVDLNSRPAAAPLAHQPGQGRRAGAGRESGQSGGR